MGRRYRAVTDITLRWDDPEDATEFLAIRHDLIRDGYLMDSARDALVELVRDSEVVAGHDGTEEGSDAPA